MARSPGPGMCLAFAARPAGWSPARVAMVGDSRHDLEAGRAAGMRTVAVLTGIARREDLAPHADVVLPDIGAIPGWLDRLNRPDEPAHSVEKRRISVAELAITRAPLPSSSRCKGNGERSMTDEPARRKRAGGRAGMKVRAGTAVIDQMPWRIPVNPDRPTEPLDADGVQRDPQDRDAHPARHRDRVPEPRGGGASASRQAASSNGTNVRMDEDFVMEMVARAPETFTITPRNPDREMIMGGKHMLFVNVSSPPNAWDLERGKRSGDFETFKEFMKLTQYFNCIHIAGGYPVEPIDIHASVRHLDCLYEKLTLTDKVVHAYSLGAERVEDVMEMVRIAGGLTEEEFQAKPRMYTNINSVSPLKHDYPMLDGAMRLAKRGQPVVVTPFTLAGAMAPVTMSGAVALSIAEALAAVALLQYIAPGCPVAIGHLHLERRHEVGGARLRHARNTCGRRR